MDGYYRPTVDVKWFHIILTVSMMILILSFLCAVTAIFMCWRNSRAGTQLKRTFLESYNLMLANNEQNDHDRRELHDLYHQKEARDQVKYLKQMELLKIENPERYRKEVAKRMGGKRGSHTSTLTNLCVEHADECKRLQKKFSAIESEFAALEETTRRHKNYSTTDLINHSHSPPH